MVEPEQQDAPQRLTCFVVGPIGSRLAELGTEGRQNYEEALEVWEDVIQPACQSVGLEPVRADGLARAGEITEQIFRRLRDDEVVIADLTGANPNVMYELGMRHTRDLLTVQIGEYGRLPFDVSAIRTIQFSRSERGLINARDELISVLRAGLAGEFDPVSATRVWLQGDSDRPLEPTTEDAPDIDESEQDRGFLDYLADGEAAYEALGPLAEEISAEIVDLGTQAEAASERMASSDAAGRGMRGRLAITTGFAAALDDAGDRLTELTTEYSTLLHSIDGAHNSLISAIEADPSQLSEAMDFAVTVRSLAKAGRDSLEGLSGLLQSMRDNAKLARVLRAPTRKIGNALEVFASATELLDDADRRLQVLGVPLEDDVSDVGDEPVVE